MVASIVLSAKLSSETPIAGDTDNDRVSHHIVSNFKLPFSYIPDDSVASSDDSATIVSTALPPLTRTDELIGSYSSPASSPPIRLSPYAPPVATALSNDSIFDSSPPSPPLVLNQSDKNQFASPIQVWVIFFVGKCG